MGRRKSDSEKTWDNEESPIKVKKKKKLDKEEKKVKPHEEEEQGDDSGSDEKEVLTNGTGESAVNGVSHNDEMEVDDIVDVGEKGKPSVAGVEDQTLDTSKDPSVTCNDTVNQSIAHGASKDMFSDSDAENLDKDRTKDSVEKGKDQIKTNQREVKTEPRTKQTLMKMMLWIKQMEVKQINHIESRQIMKRRGKNKLKCP